jgi:hypothetical protein
MYVNDNQKATLMSARELINIPLLKARVGTWTTLSKGTE